MFKQTIEDVDFKGKGVIVRVDFNVPIKEGKITDDTRISATLPTINYILSKEPKNIVLMSHLGRPDGQVKSKESLAPVAKRLEELLKRKVLFLKDCVGEEIEKQVHDTKESQVILLENLRFHAEEEGQGIKGEKKFKPKEEEIKKFRKSLSNLGDVYVNDAFGTAHRAHSSMVGIDKQVRVSGYLMKKELDYFAKVLVTPQRPFLAILGGAKVKDKIQLINNLLDKVDQMIIVGGMAYTFKKVLNNLKIGKSLFDEEGSKIVNELMEKAKKKGVKIYLPIDHVCGDKFDKNANVKTFTDEEGIGNEWIGMDIGSKSISQFKDIILGSKTIFWNGTAGVTEFKSFVKGSQELLSAVIQATENGAASIIGGGDSAGFIAQEGKEKLVSHVSTGGGASIELLEGKTLPGVAFLCDKSKI